MIKSADEKKQDADLLHRAMATLSEDHREVLVLSRFQELRYEEIAGILNVSEGAVKVRVHRALEALKKVFLTTEKRKSI
jgi:RNA polymerase sigma factor (sigma-70 family)